MLHTSNSDEVIKAQPGSWTRRQFMRGAAGLAVLPLLVAEDAPHFAYVAQGARTISVFAHADGSKRWSVVQQVSSPRPACLLLSPTHQVLYVANDVAVHDGEPRGTVQTFRIDPNDGTLTLAACRPLSLSASHPRHLALSPDGKLLAVAAYGGGIYNLLPVEAYGNPGAACGIFKDAGCGPHAAWQTSSHPHTLLFDSSGKHLLSTDFGSDRINVFAIREGRLDRTGQYPSAAGSGPGSAVLHPSGFLYASHHLADSLVCFRYDESSGAVSEAMRYASAAGSLALHPAGLKLYTTHEQSKSLRVWRVNRQNGTLALTQNLLLGQTAPTHVSVASDGKGVYISCANGRCIMKFSADPASGKLTASADLFKVDSPASIALRVI